MITSDPVAQLVYLLTLGTPGLFTIDLIGENHDEPYLRSDGPAC
jgi:hypothetical protein